MVHGRTLGLGFGVLAAALLAACGGQVVSDPGDSEGIGTDGSTVQPDVEGPACISDADCAAFYEAAGTVLGGCEVAVCGAGGACERQIVDDPSGCDDDSPCTEDSCAPDGTCIHQKLGGASCCESDTDCNDGNPCKQGVCGSGGTCKFAAVEGSCDDGNPCTTNDACLAGDCAGEDTGTCQLACLLTGAAGEIADCPLGVARLGEASPPAVALAFDVEYDETKSALQSFVDAACLEGICAESPIPDAGNSLVPSGHTVTLEPATPAEWSGTVAVDVTHLGSPDTAISPAFIAADVIEGDTSFLTLRFLLSKDVTDEPVLLKSLAAAGAADGALTAQVKNGLIVTTDAPCGGDVCWDGEPCTLDQCDGGVCSHVLDDAPCDDGNPCTTGDTCGEGGLCVGATPAAEGTDCTGADLCNEIGTCDGLGSCIYDAGKAITCDDGGNPCATASCDPATGGCVFAIADGASCDDGSKCTTGDACNAEGTCAGTSLDCDDGVGCTTDGCNAATGCTHAGDDLACDDEDPCTDDVCTDAGCDHLSNTAACDDGDPCTKSDACKEGACKGKIDPVCGCGVTADCAELEDGNACNGTFFCDGGACKIDPETVVECMADGFQCKVDWTCNPATGECEGTPMNCDDGDACTNEICSVTKGCEYELIAGCALNWICELSGKKGDVVECKVQLARGLASDPKPSGADVKLSWDAAKVKIDNLSDSFCIGPTCFPFDLVACDPSGQTCSTQKLEPTGHDVVVVPDQMADWVDWLAILLFHATTPGKAITEAVKSGASSVTGDPLVLLVRFELLADVPAASPVKVFVSDYHFNPATGLDLDVSIEPFGDGRLFVATTP